ncbi:aspartate aminotransferase family protein [uncultured Cyclobacterium sp.]|uniref:aspartate aminotransferase family protein n=1 Tax=uncultured Cyclobacterium sp. TaxID=453820 RepID=UPI0030EF345D|tara:strand:- start:347843 stop:349024 length:1182 start_codon:yes stop_codon:yes gene_type:complete
MNNRQLFLSHLAQTTDFPLLIEIEKAEGVFLYGPKGEKYMDLIAGIGVSNIGHRHPKVLEAIRNQLDKYLHLMVYGEYVQQPQNLLAKALVDTLPQGLDNVYLVNSGSEAIEGALKLAKRYNNRKEIISCTDAYHGSSHGALSIGGNEIFKRAYRPLLPGIRNIAYGVEDQLSFITTETAAIILETIQGEAGIRVADKHYFRALREKCNQTGTLLILDEVQAGFGRTGKFWAFEHFDIQPDILVCAKGMGGGMPIGAFISSKKIMDALKENPLLGHITTFGGHPVSAAASLATIKAILDENLITQVEEKAELFKSLLKHPKIKEIRNKGLMMAVAFDSFDVLKPIIDRCIAGGVITDWFLYCDNAMRIAPPLTISKEEIRLACKCILQAIDEE